MSVSKRLIATALALVLVAGLVTAAFAQGKAGDKVPHMVIVKKSVDLGDILEGQDVLYTFRLQNIGAGELQVLNVKPG